MLREKKPSEPGFSVVSTDDQADQQSSGSETDTSEQSMNDEDQDMEISHDAVKANLFKERGNQYFKKGDFDEAVNSYTIAIQADISNPVLYGNRAMALLKKADLLCSRLAKDDPVPRTALDLYQAADQDCSQALRLDKDFVKAYFRRGMARKALGMIQEALFDFEAVGRLDPGNSLAEKTAQTLKIELWAKGKGQKRFFTEFKSSPVLPCPKKDSWSGELKRMRIEELNLNDKKQTQANATTKKDAEEKMDIVVKVTVPSPPTTSYQFYADWRHLEHHSTERTEYLMAMSPEVVKEIFKNSLEADVLSDIIALLHKAVIEQGGSGDNGENVWSKATALLEALTNVGRFDTLIMFLEKEETHKLREILKGEARVQKLWKLQ